MTLSRSPSRSADVVRDSQCSTSRATARANRVQGSSSSDTEAILTPSSGSATDNEAGTETSPLVEDRSSLHGRGAFATRDYKPGELVTITRPLLFKQWPTNRAQRPSATSICQDIAALSNERLRVTFHILQWANKGAYIERAGLPYLREFFREAFSAAQTDAVAIMGFGGFPPPQMRWEGWTAVSYDATLLNHSCRPNVVATYDWESEEIQVVAVKNVTKGEELTMSYINVWATRKVREERLGFSCNCAECRLEGAQLTLSNDERKKMGARLGDIMRFRQSCGVKQDQAFTMLDERAEWLKEKHATHTENVSRAAMRAADLLRPFPSVELFFAADTAAASITAKARADANKISIYNLEDVSIALEYRLKALRALKIVVRRDCERRDKTILEICLLFERSKDDGKMWAKVKEYCDANDDPIVLAVLEASFGQSC